MSVDVPGVFASRLPRRPYCSNDKTASRIRPAAQALRFSYIQPNSPVSLAWLIFDLDFDYLSARERWDWPTLPTPTITVINPSNCHAHLFFGLETPVVTSEQGRDTPIRYATFVEAAYAIALRADAGYSGLMAKNPFNSAWLVEYGAALYTLGYLAEFVKLPKRIPPRDITALGRNCMMFDTLRSWAYQWVRHYKKNASAVQWRAAVEGQARALNEFDTPLPDSVVRSVSRSVAGWTWRRFNDSAFSRVQAERGRKGGVAKGVANEQKRASAKLMAAQGYGVRAIAAELDVSKSSVAVWLHD